jgi:3-hydroxy-9,10-secoandrosta-1,3,5(10)-triene-9,17-dione monooxygenase reductase component
VTDSNSPTLHRQRRSPTGSTALDPRIFRDALGLYASGITVIAGHDGDEPLGFTCQSFYSVSTDPPLISFSVMVTSSTYPRIRETGKFSVNVLSKAQRPISNQFARSGIDRWAGIAWKMSDGQNPIIDGTLTWLDCGIVDEHQAGDHYIVIGQVLTIGSNDRHVDEPLVYFKGNYRHLNDSDGSTA